jgi:hypothetical protein
MDEGTFRDYLEDVIRERNRVIEERDHWRSLAERAMENLNEAMRILQDIQQAVYRD